MVGDSDGTLKNASVWSVIGLGKRIFVPTKVRQKVTNESRRYIPKNGLR
jgi:hypothetical protein